MLKVTDAMVTAADLMQAIEERSRGYSDATMARLYRCEPTMAAYVESLAYHFSNEQRLNVSDLDEASRKALRHLLVIVRAIEIGQYRLWRGSIDPASPLGRMIAPIQAQDERKSNQEKSKE
jgi:hypothetical protein